MSAHFPGPSSPEPGRRLRRHPIAVPVDISVFRSGRQENIPGRSLDIGEGGMSAVLASELHPGDAIDVEFHLPGLETAFHARAVVRHQGAVGCGIEFVELSSDQRQMMRQWAGESLEEEQQPSDLTPENQKTSRFSKLRLTRLRRGIKRAASVAWYRLPEIILIVAIVALVTRWHWEREWQRIEAPLRAQAVADRDRDEPISVPAKVMEPLLQNKVEPAYPAGAHGAAGVVLLDVVVGRTGEVEHIHLVSGNEVLARAAAGSVKQWRFLPYQVNGEPKQVETTVAIGFRPE
jgi:TonB family protein